MMLLARHPRTASRVIDGRAVIISIDTNRVLTLNEQGTRVWQVLARPTTLEEVVAMLCREYEVTEERARADGARFCEEMVVKGLLTNEP
jgi:tRNA G37 N-methylase TrmD